MNLLQKTFAVATMALASLPVLGKEIECTGAYVDTIAVEARRSESTQIQNSLVISFKDAQGNHHNCNGNVPVYVYLKASNEAVFNAMSSIAFMARANNYKVKYVINTGASIYSAEELAYIQIVENTAIPSLK